MKLLGIYFLLSSFYANASSITICMTGKLEVALPEYKVGFLNAVDLALNQSMASQYVQIKTYFYDNKPLSSLRAYRHMMHDDCAAIIGFEYLSDLLLVNKFQKNYDIPIFTSYASNNSKDKLSSNIFIFMPSYDYQAQKMLQFLNAKFGNIDKVLIITEVDRIDLAKYKVSYGKLLEQAKIAYDEFDFVGDDNQLEKKIAKFLINKEYSFVFLLSSAVASTKAINLMNDHKITFIGTENFGSSTNQSLFVRLNDKKLSAYTIRNIDFLKQNKQLTKYKQLYIKKYAMMPSPLSAYTYDAMMIILKAIEKSHLVNTQTILDINFYGITGINISNKQFHRSNQYVILSINEQGFVYER